MSKLCAGLLGAAMASAMALSANAADWYGGPQGPAGYKDVPYAVATWTGFYAGVNAGYGWSENSDQLAYADSTVPVTFGGVQPSGGFGGGQIGYNWQGGWGYSPLVLGVEADVQVSGIDGEGGDAAGDAFRSRLEMFGTVRGRIGYSFGQTLAYFTGGFAYGSIKNEAVINAGVNAGADFVTNRTATGYVLGGGFEYKINPSISVKAEYQYINLGTNDPADINGVATPPQYSNNGGTIYDDAFHTFRVGLNWFPFVACAPLPLK